MREKQHKTAHSSYTVFMQFVQHIPSEISHCSHYHPKRPMLKPQTLWQKKTFGKIREKTEGELSVSGQGEKTEKRNRSNSRRSFLISFLKFHAAAANNALIVGEFYSVAIQRSPMLFFTGDLCLWNIDHWIGTSATRNPRSMFW